MKRKRLLAFLLAFCMCISQIVTVSATGVTDTQEEMTTEDDDESSEEAQAEEADDENQDQSDASDGASSDSTGAADETGQSGSDDESAESDGTEDAEQAESDGEEDELFEEEAAALTQEVTEESGEVKTVLSDTLTAVDTNAQIWEDFEGEDAAELWGLTGDLVDNGMLVIATSDDGNNYLNLNGAKLSQQTASVTFEDIPTLSSATFTYNVYIENTTTDSKVGRVGVQLSGGGVEIISIYTGEARTNTAAAPVYYSVYGDTGFTTISGATVQAGEWVCISVDIDFEKHTADILIDGTVVAEAVAISKAVTTLDGLELNMASTNSLSTGRTYTIDIGYDNFSISYEALLEKGSETEEFEDEDASDLWGFTGDLVDNEMLVLGTEEENTYLNLNGAKLSQQTAVKYFEDIPTLTSATFSYDIYIANTTTDSKVGRVGLQLLGGGVEIISIYTGEARTTGASAPVYYSVYGDTGFTTISDVTLTSGTWANISVDIDFEKHTAVIYIDGTAVATVTISSAVSTLDSVVLNMASTNTLSTGRTYTIDIRYDNFAFNWVGSAVEASVMVSSVAEIEDITVTKDEWTNGYEHPSTVSVTLSDRSVVEMEVTTWLVDNEMDLDDKGTYVWTGVLVLPEGITNPLGLTATYTMNYMADFVDSDIYSLAELDQVTVTKEDWEAGYTHPTQVTATLVDGSTITVDIDTDTWACEEFDADKQGYYTWTADIILPEGNANPKGLKATYVMQYASLAYVVWAPNPNTLELEFGESWSEDELPTTVTAYLSDGTSVEIPVSGWEAIRAFDSSTEGIYVYGVNLESVEGVCDVYRDLIKANEYHVSGDDKDKYTYDVYYRISYYETEDNYNGYERSMELLDRGVYAVQSESGEGILVSWRLLIDEYGTDVEFYVYRNGELITDEPITDVTNYLDTEGVVGDVYTIKTVQDGEYWISDAYVATEENYISIALQNPGPQQDIQGNWVNYTINDCGTADVDGDGELELIVKWYPDDAFDSGKQGGPSAPTIFDVYEMDGTALWRLNMGLDIPSGAHWNQFMLYDLDEDGCAELFIKTSDGTTSYRPNEDGLFDMTDESTIISVMGDASLAGTHILSTGHVSSEANEWITVYDGATGELICYTDYIYETTNSSDYGDTWYNRASRYNIAIAYQPADQSDPTCTTTIPTVLFNHGYYAKTTVAAYTLRTAEDGSKYLQLEWGFDSSDYPDESYGGKGNHNVATGDVDNDGFDELVIGAMCLDHDGNVLWVKDGTDGQDVEGHSDALSLAAMNPDDPTQLYVFTPQEDVSTATVTQVLSNAGTGTRITGRWFSSSDDIGRGLAANITPTPGYEYWTTKGSATGYGVNGIYNFTEGLLVENKPSNMKVNFIVYWDGDLLSELLDSDSTEGAATVYKYNWEENTLDTMFTMEGTKLNNSTKNTPSLTADLLGDWREEVVVRGEDDETLYIYMTNYETDYAIYSLMYDPVYRNAVANQNTAYNQPPHVGFYLGEDNADQVLAMELPVANISYTTTKAAGSSAAEEEESFWAEVLEQIENAESGETVEITVDFSVTSSIPKTALSALQSSGVSLTVNTPSTVYTITPEDVEELEELDEDGDSVDLDDVNTYYNPTPDESDTTPSGDPENVDSESWEDVVDALNNGDPVVYVPDGYDSIPDWVMNSLPDIDVTFVFPDGTEITIPAGEAPDPDDGIEWYGPEWLKEHYGNTSTDGATDPTTTDGTATDSAATGDSMSSMLMMFAVIMIVAAAGIYAVVVNKRRGQQSR